MPWYAQRIRKLLKTKHLRAACENSSSGSIHGDYFPSMPVDFIYFPINLEIRLGKTMSNSTWQTTTKSAAALSLDPKNPRLAQISQQATDRELLEELVTKEDVFGIAKSIVENGYFQNEVLVAVREGGKTIVAEGNCRLAACKLLVSPDAAPAKFQAKFRALAANANLMQLKQIPICIAPSRETTFPILLKRHTKIPICYVLLKSL